MTGKTVFVKIFAVSAAAVLSLAAPASAQTFAVNAPGTGGGDGWNEFTRDKQQKDDIKVPYAPAEKQKNNSASQTAGEDNSYGGGTTLPEVVVTGKAPDLESVLGKVTGSTVPSPGKVPDIKADVPSSSGSAIPDGQPGSSTYWSNQQNKPSGWNSYSGGSTDKNSDGTALPEVVITGKAGDLSKTLGNFTNTPPIPSAENIPNITAGGNGQTFSVSTTVTENNNGNISSNTENSSFTLNDGSGSAGSKSKEESSSGTGTAETSGGAKSGATGKDDVKNGGDLPEVVVKAEDLSKYTGLYNGRQLIPDIMARHCRITGEEVAKDPQKYIDCIKQYVSEMNNPDAAAKAEAEKQYQTLKYKTLLDNAAAAITKSQAVKNFEETLNKYLTASGEMFTEHGDNQATINTLGFVAEVLNSLRELQAEELKYNAMSAIADLDPAVVLDEEQKEEKSSSASSDSEGASADYHGVSAQTTIGKDGKTAAEGSSGD